MGIIEWATSPLGQNVPIHIAWFLIWVALIAGLLFLVVHAIYIRYFAKEKEFAADTSPEIASPVARTHSQALAGGAAVSLDHGGLDVHAAVHRIPAQGGRSVRLGDLPLDRGHGADHFHNLSHHPRVFLYGLLVHLAGPGRSRRRLEKGQPLHGKAVGPCRGSSPNIRWRTSFITAPSFVTGLSVIVTGVFMMSRVRTIFFPRNPYLFGDMTWGMMYVLHGLAGVGLITLVIVHVYFAIRPEKLPITASMIVGTMSRDFYLKEHDPERWVVETSSSSSSGQRG